MDTDGFFFSKKNISDIHLTREHHFPTTSSSRNLVLLQLLRLDKINIVFYQQISFEHIHIICSNDWICLGFVSYAFGLSFVVVQI